VKPLLDTPVSLAIAAVNVIYFLIAQSRGNTLQTETLIRFGALERRHIWSGQYWRLITACFLHIGWLHLIINTVFIFRLSQGLEEHLGWHKLLVAYLMTGIGASAVSVLGHTSISAGASGAGFGLVGLLLMVYLHQVGSLDKFMNDDRVRQILGQTAIWFVIGIFSRFDNFAHGGGLAFGLIFGYVLAIPTDEVSVKLISLYVVAVVVWSITVLASLSPRFARRDVDDF
jgi:rhomboid protease GluP